MRLFLLFLGITLVGVWLNIVFNHYFQPGGLKPNWLLVFALVLVFRHQAVLFPFFGIVLGLICDALSHGIMGLYGISFFIALLLTRELSRLFYADTFLAVSFAVFSMSLLEGALALSILKMLEPELSRMSLLLNPILPLAALQGVLAPIIHQGIVRVERHFLGSTT